MSLKIIKKNDIYSVEKIKGGTKWYSSITASELIKILIDKGLITEEDLGEVENAVL